MRKLSILFFLTLSFNFLGLQNVYCQSADPTLNPWIIIDGPGAGIQLVVLTER